MRTLWILRHAKAEAHSSEDHGRKLAPRGRRQGAELAEHLSHLADSADRPALVVSSSATRAVETAHAVLPGLVPGAQISVEPALYQADPDEVMDVVRGTDDELSSVMVVGHNPTFQELALMVLEGADEDGRRRIEDGLPTGSLAVVGFDVDRWVKVSAGGGRLVELFVPTSR